MLLLRGGCGSNIVASPIFHFDKADGSSATGNKTNLASMAFPPLGENPVKADKQPDDHKGLCLPGQLARHGGVDQSGDAGIHVARPWSSDGSIFGPGAVTGNGKRDTVDTVLGNAGGTDDIGDGIAQSLAVHFSTQ